MSQNAADELKVPENDREAFFELYDTLKEAAGGVEPPKAKLKNWQDKLKESRAMATVHVFMKSHEAEVQEAVMQLQKAGSSNGNLERMITQRMIFTGVYGKEYSLEEALQRVVQELKKQMELSRADSKQTSKPFILQPGRFDKRHQAVREMAYPYTPACAAWHGDAVLDCLHPDGTTLVGYMAMHDSYADDLSVNPEYHGRGVAKALVCGVATRLLHKGRAEMTLDVRACNLPAFEMYKHLGFRVTQRRFPAFYDWHGGYSMAAPTKEIAEKLPEGKFDVSRLV